ncbi:MAG: YihA family ribosome biogenesis GTP-binding protein [Deltaproteobacteria bacterium]|nr:MAG: YihA family ribosome biogenesis GTP-binding protein [Deltaproteobacteria bacterium]
MKIKSAEFITSAVKPSQYPPAVLPEIAFAGRSNVGKSSLINTLLNRKRLVKTSSKPGHTQLINFFLVNEKFSFVDLPGYGYAKVPASIQKNWGPMIEIYLAYRKTLKGIVLIMDIRRIPGKYELDIMDWLFHYDIPAVLIMTKADKLSKTKQIKQHFLISKALSVDKNGLILFSAKSRQGKDNVWDAVEKLLIF